MYFAQDMNATAKPKWDLQANGIVKREQRNKRKIIIYNMDEKNSESFIFFFWASEHTQANGTEEEKSKRNSHISYTHSHNALALAQNSKHIRNK